MRERGNRRHWVDDPSPDPFSDGFMMIGDDDPADRCRTVARIDAYRYSPGPPRADIITVTASDRRRCPIGGVVRAIDAEMKKARASPRAFAHALVLLGIDHRLLRRRL